jgi:hypothetical protein
LRAQGFFKVEERGEKWGCWGAKRPSNPIFRTFFTTFEKAILEGWRSGYIVLEAAEMVIKTMGNAWQPARHLQEKCNTMQAEWKFLGVTVHVLGISERKNGESFLFGFQFGSSVSVQINNPPRNSIFQ